MPSTEFRIHRANELLNSDLLNKEIEDIKADATFSLTDPKDSFEALQKLQSNVGGVQQKVKDGLAQTYDPQVAANRLALLKLTGDVVNHINTELGGDVPVQPGTSDEDPAAPATNVVPAPFTTRQVDKGYGADAAVPVAASAETDSSNLITEVLPAVVGTAARAGAAALAGSLIKRRDDGGETEEDIASGMNHSAVEPEIQDDEQLLKAYYELVNSLDARVEDTYEDLQEIDVQTGKDDSSAIKIKVLGYCVAPQTKAAKAQEDAVGYESYMKHSTANPKKWG